MKKIHQFFQQVSKDEAILRLVLYQGEFLTYNILSSKLYPFHFLEQLFNTFLKIIIQKHMSSIQNSRYLFSPFSFLIHESLVLYFVRSITTLPSAIKQEIAKQLRLQSTIKENNEEKENETKFISPQTQSERRKLINEQKLYEFRNWFIKGTEGHLIDYLAMRHSFTSSLAYISAMNIIFHKSLPDIPNMAISADKQWLQMPGFFKQNRKLNNVTSIPLIEEFLYFIPNYVLKGSFSTSFLTIIDSLSNNMNKLRAILSVLWEERNETNETEIICKRVQMLSSAVTEDSENTFLEFPFAVIDFLIDQASNRNVTHHSLSWI